MKSSSAVRSDVPISGALTLDVVRGGLPSSSQPTDINGWRKRNAIKLLRGVPRLTIARALGLPHYYGALHLKVFRGDGRIEDLGLVGLKLVTTAGVNFIVDAFQNTTEVENMKFHGFGTGTNSEATGDTALQTELTTQYATDNTRPTGTTTEGASANIYRTVATLAPDANVAITEHGVFSQAATGGGTLLDRTVFSAVNLVGGSDSLQVTYDLTFSAGG